MKPRRPSDQDRPDQSHLMAELGRVRAALERHADGGPKLTVSRAHPAGDRNPANSPLTKLCELFGLSGFERDVLAMCAGIELQADFAALCARALGDMKCLYATFGLALAALPDPHWSVLSPAHPLRYWRLVELKDGPGLSQNPLRIDERILHFLTGLDAPDERLQGVIEPALEHGELAPTQLKVARQLAGTWHEASRRDARPPLQLCGDCLADKRAIAIAACEIMGLHARFARADSLPTVSAELEALIRLWDREAALTGDVLILDCDDTDQADNLRERTIQRWLERTHGLLIVTTRQRKPVRFRATVAFDAAKPTSTEQRTIWENATRETNLPADEVIGRLVAQFDLSAPTIRAACLGAVARMTGAGERKPPEASAMTTLWDACRIQVRTRLDDLAQRVEPYAAWDDLVLPESKKAILREIATHVRQRKLVYETWGFAHKGARGLGIAALFAGSSGTGKTMAAEVLAADLRLDLYHIDLSAVVSKYIGETEKNLKRVFDAAEEGGVVLLFDEADALFGKRTETKDSHDRYANIEVSYLLQRMEAYQGLAVLTTNFLEALDPAFVRRIRFTVQFTFPNSEERKLIWQRAFPPTSPTNALDASKLASLNVAGGSIRNIAVKAAFLAADAGEPISMPHILQAARSEYAKNNRPLIDTEIAGWLCNEKSN